MTRPGGQLRLFCFADTDSPGFKLPTRVSRDNLRTHLSGHWNIRSIELTQYTTTFTRESLQRQNPDTLQARNTEIDLDAVRTDKHGRVISPVWHLHALRRGKDEVAGRSTTRAQHIRATETGDEQ